MAEPRVTPFFTVRTQADHPDVDGFTEKLQRMYQSGDLTEIAEICAEEQVAVYRRELDTLRSYGLTKRLRADTATAKSGKPPEPFFVQTTDGKNDLSYTNGQVPYVEEFSTPARSAWHGFGTGTASPRSAPSECRNSTGNDPCGGSPATTAATRWSCGGNNRNARRVVRSSGTRSSPG